jgi:DNA-binding NarL/FixJ family response regulator
MSDPAVRVVLVDDDPLVRTGHWLVLGGAPRVEIVGEAGDGAEGLDVIGRTRPDVVLMDIRMPRMDGLAATQRLLGRPDPPKVVVLTTFDADEYVVRALASGARGFLLKDTAPAMIVEAIESVAAGEPMLSPSVTAQLIRRVVDASSATGADTGRARAAAVVLLRPGRPARRCCPAAAAAAPTAALRVGQRRGRVEPQLEGLAAMPVYVGHDRHEQTGETDIRAPGQGWTV